MWVWWERTRPLGKTWKTRKEASTQKLEIQNSYTRHSLKNTRRKKDEQNADLVGNMRLFTTYTLAVLRIYEEKRHVTLRALVVHWLKCLLHCETVVTVRRSEWWLTSIQIHFKFETHPPTPTHPHFLHTPFPQFPPPFPLLSPPPSFALPSPSWFPFPLVA